MKRMFDLLCVAMMLPFAGVISIFICVAILLDSGRPVIFRSRRVGRGGTLFYMLKFRTMHQDGDRRISPEQRAILQRDFKLVGDPRVTRVGRFLRRTGLDELPQLVNVIRGEMSLVGPRPKLPEEMPAWGTHAHEVVGVRPGVTGLWQVLRTSAASDESMQRLDLEYVRNRSLILDLFILWRTPAAMLRKVDD